MHAVSPKSWIVDRGSWMARENRSPVTGHRSLGFTLLELLITVAIISLVATVALPLAELTVQRGKELELKRSLRQIRDGIDAYKRAADEGRVERRSGASGYPPSLKALVEGVTDARSPEAAKMVFLRRIPRDPFHRDAGAPPEQTWGLRSHASPGDYPRAGEDVFDVYSTSRTLGLNGVPIKEW
jgi:general secretion pathway protein G